MTGPNALLTGIAALIGLCRCAGIESGWRFRSPMLAEISAYMISHVFFITVDGVSPSAAGLARGVFGITPTVVDQFDLRGIASDELSPMVDLAAFRRRYGCEPSPGEVGCALAHRHCWMTLLEAGGECALVLEDDAFLRDAEALPRLMSSLPSWDLINLRITSGMFRRAPVHVSPGIDVFRASTTCFGAYAYLLKRTCAEQFVRRQTPFIRNFADWPDEVWNYRVWGVRGNIVDLRERPSTLGHTSDHGLRARGLERVIHAARSIHFRARRAYRRRLCGDISF